MRLAERPSNGRSHSTSPASPRSSPAVAKLIGSAELTIEREGSARRLGPGDHVFLPAHCRHRVERTASPTIWLAVHIEPAK